MKYAVKCAGLCLTLATLNGCGTVDGVNDSAENRFPPATTKAGSVYGTVSDFPQKIGDPYQVEGKTYTPEDVASYDNVGYASWYGQELVGNSTANGEVFNPDGISAAHKTLPLPSYVEVTALDTGRTILVRINDRGPFASDRLLDLSYGAAKQLGIDGQGVAGVRVRKVNPNEQERAVLRSGGVAVERIATPDSLLSILRTNLAKLPTPQQPVPQIALTNNPAPNKNSSGIRHSGTSDGKFIVEGAGQTVTRQPIARPMISENSVGNNYIGNDIGDYVVQVAAFSSKSRADTMARKIEAKVMPDGTRKIWRVRYGPYASEADANAGLAQAKKRGYSGARILRAQ